MAGMWFFLAAMSPAQRAKLKAISMMQSGVPSGLRGMVMPAASSQVALRRVVVVSAAGFGGVDPFGVFDGGEFIEAVGFVYDAGCGEREGVEDEGFEFDGVRFFGFYEMAAVDIDVRDLFLRRDGTAGRSRGR